MKAFIPILIYAIVSIYIDDNTGCVYVSYDHPYIRKMASPRPEGEPYIEYEKEPP